MKTWTGQHVRDLPNGGGGGLRCEYHIPKDIRLHRPSVRQLEAEQHCRELGERKIVIGV